MRKNRHIASKIVGKLARSYNEAHKRVRPPAPFLPNIKGHIYMEGNLVKRIVGNDG